VATTVIEVGVDVSNASVMVISDADRFGISQLHQLRGRIGRGAHPGVCLLLTTTDEESVARQRLDAVAATRDGFALAEVDLEQRPGRRRAGRQSVRRPVQPQAAARAERRRPDRRRPARWPNAASPPTRISPTRPWPTSSPTWRWRRPETGWSEHEPPPSV
jgi:superfamily II DNA/RNA helicase